ncbi:hypothetical protein ANACOL_03577 [Anaerotruncus colihominis DSM 17241]|uniref:Uncharacterized protein n=1 Tax=Anaerotruncus colihominis DSM 17241 TaxID=445972 RepID=B0PFJ6_9FIRM|nr:hypothetical protein ANACOL_03577 [Anaerotruncus colihominis DSM 17241]
MQPFTLLGQPKIRKNSASHLISQIIQQIDLNQHWTPPSYHMIQIGSKTPVFPPAWVLLQQTGFTEVIQRPLDRRAGKPQLQSNCSDGRPAASLAVCPILEVHIDAPGSVA